MAHLTDAYLLARYAELLAADENDERADASLGAIVIELDKRGL